MPESFLRSQHGISPPNNAICSTITVQVVFVFGKYQNLKTNRF